jgi:PAS domain S-box-containing protein
MRAGSPLVEAMINMIPADIVIFSVDHRYRYINKNAIVSEERRRWLIGKDDYDYCRIANKPTSIADGRRYYFNKCISEGVNIQFEETINTNNGKEYRIRAMNPIFDDNGELAFVMGYGFNDNRRGQMETMLNELKSALDSAADGIAVLDTEGNYTYMNSSHANIFGYEHPDELIGKGWHTIYDEDEKNVIETHYMPVLFQEGSWHGETRGQHKNGSNVFQDITLTVLQDGGLICITRDQTEIRKMLYETRKLAVIAEKTKSMVMICNNSGGVDWANQSFYNYTGSTEDDKKYLTLKSLFELEDDPLHMSLMDVRKILNEKGEWQGKVRLKKKDGTKIWILLNVTALYDKLSNVRSFVCIQLDFNDLHELELRLYDSNTKEKQLNQIKSKFINVTSHEIRTPLTNIELSADIIKRSLSNEERALLNLGKISSQVKHITNILDDFLILSKVEVGNVEINHQPFVLHNSVQEVVANKISINDENRIRQTIVGTPRPIYTDEKLLQIIVKNIIENAIKYSPDNKPIDLSVIYERAAITFKVKDYGIGIPLESQDKLFLSFYRAPNVEFIKGSGLGLTIVKEFLDLLGGTITFESIENQFTEFTISFANEKNLSN